MNNSKVLKQTLKKAFKLGLFHSFVMQKDYLSFKDVNNNLYTLNSPDNIGFWFRIGTVQQWQELAPTFESEYNCFGMVDKARFIDRITPVHTDNPDYIYRICKQYNSLTIN